MADYYRNHPDNPWRFADDPVASILAAVWGDNRREVEQGHRRHPELVPRLLDAVERVLELHPVHAVEHAPEGWPCPVVRAIAAALLGEGQ